jgi:hypothetical protein
MFPDVGDRETFEHTLKITIFPRQCFSRLAKALVISEIINLFLDRVNCMYIYILSVLFDTGGFLPHTNVY